MRIYEAMKFCKVRGCIARESKKEIKYWKNVSRDNPKRFPNLHNILPPEDMLAEDWETFDPEGEEGSIVG